ncbi:hypothetical protein DERP_005878 [Dermatophagoides pteronyssinus]|uniref:Nucleoside 2-deoxyribosyltransferase like protein n=1 Tax=Dermatophagoides pteronyssinus TaxID=6956 RepID=A0ABQ8JAG3_DERPT|nr:hypothetical protein DERP_005878 [Dermatophagoides pteronyssinus]
MSLAIASNLISPHSFKSNDVRCHFENKTIDSILENPYFNDDDDEKIEFETFSSSSSSVVDTVDDADVNSHNLHDDQHDNDYQFPLDNNDEDFKINNYNFDQHEGKQLSQSSASSKTSDTISTTLVSNVKHHYDHEQNVEHQKNKTQSVIAINDRRHQHKLSCSLSDQVELPSICHIQYNQEQEREESIIIGEKETNVDSCYFSGSDLSLSESSSEGIHLPLDDHQSSIKMSPSLPTPFVYGELTRRWHDAWLSDNSKDERNINSKETNLATVKHDDKDVTANYHFMTKSNSISFDKHFKSNNSYDVNYNNPITYQRRLIRDIQAKYHKIDLYPTESQIYEMIQFASKCSRRRTLHTISAAATTETTNSKQLNNNDNNKPSETGLTFGEFCFFASVLTTNARESHSRQSMSNHVSSLHMEHSQPQLFNHGFPVTMAHYNNRNSSQTPIHYSFPYLRGGHLSNHRTSLVDHPGNSNQNKFDIFLGGSCNPTRWRSDLVMPQLKKKCLTYYNPQVDHWGPELIEMESYAKQNSEVLFFVVDNQTRAIASMIEVAFIAALSRKLILVIIDLEPWSEQMVIGNDHISKEEYEYLRRGRQYLRDIVERQEIPIFCDISKALRSAIQVLEENVWPQNLALSDDVIPVKNGRISLGEKIIQVYQVYNQSKNSKEEEVTMEELNFAYLSWTRREITSDLLRQIARWHLAQKSSDGKTVDIIPPLDQIPLDFNDFCIIVSELEIQWNRMQNISDENEISQNVERISEGSESSDTAGRDSFTSTTTIETDSDSCITLNSKKKTKSKKKSSKSEKRSSSNETTNTVLNQFVEKVSAVIKSLIDSGIGINNESNVPSGGTKKEKNRKRQNSSRTNKSNCIKYNDKTDVIGKVKDSSYPPPEEYLMRSSQSLNHLNLDIDYYPHQSQQHRHHQLSYHLSPHHQNQHHNNHYHLTRHRNSVSPFRKSSSPRLAYMDQSNINYEDPHVNYRRRSYNQHRSSATFLPPLQSSHRQPTPFMISSSSQTSINSMNENGYDLYLGGYLDPTLLRDKIIPLLKKNSITFSSPKFDKQAKYERMTPLEAINIEKCRLLLFVIPEDSLDISSMIVAAHYVGLEFKVVLCIQYINPAKSKLASKLSPMAIKDYNRGRSYLSDMATKSHVPVFDDIDEAIECCIERCQR